MTAIPPITQMVNLRLRLIDRSPFTFFNGSGGTAPRASFRSHATDAGCPRPHAYMSLRRVPGRAIVCFFQTKRLLSVVTRAAPLFVAHIPPRRVRRSLQVYLQHLELRSVTRRAIRARR